MVKLIDKGALNFRCTYNGVCVSDKKECLKCLDYACDIIDIQNLPTTTEAEIRAKAIEEFAKEIEAEYDNDACPNVADYLDYKISLRDLFRIAEQLKGE